MRSRAAANPCGRDGSPVDVYGYVSVDVSGAYSGCGTRAMRPGSNTPRLVVFGPTRITV